MIVIIKLRSSASYVIGRLSVQEENSIELQDAFHIWQNFEFGDLPSLMFNKYCIYTTSYNVSFQKDDILHLFKDVDQSVVRMYNDFVNDFKLKTSRTEKRKRSKKITPETLAFFEKMTSNTEIH